MLTACTAGLLGAPAAHAEPAAAATTLSWRAEPGAETCTGEPALRAMLAQRLAGSTNAPRGRVAGIVRRAEDGWIAELALFDADEQPVGTRELRTQGACSELDEAAVVISLAHLRGALELLVELEEEPDQPPPPASPPSAPIAAMAPRAQLLPLVPPERDSDLPPDNAHSYSVAAGPVGVWGLVTDFAVGAALHADFGGPGTVRWRLGAVAARGARTKLGASSFALDGYWGSLQGCLPLVSGRAELATCVGAAAGTLRFASESPEAPPTASYFSLFDLTGSAGVHFPLGAAWFLTAIGELHLPIGSRRIYAYEAELSQVVHEGAVVGSQLGVFAGIHLD